MWERFSCGKDSLGRVKLGVVLNSGRIESRVGKNKSGRIESRVGRNKSGRKDFRIENIPG
jgi:hypothetical protein